MKSFLRDLHESISDSDVDTLFVQYDKDGNGAIDFDEFVDACYNIIRSAHGVHDEQRTRELDVHEIFAKTAIETIGEDGTENEVEDLPDDICHLSPEDQQTAIKRKAFGMLTLGTSLVLIFSGKDGLMNEDSWFHCISSRYLPYDFCVCSYTYLSFPRTSRPFRSHGRLHARNRCAV